MVAKFLFPAGLFFVVAFICFTSPAKTYYISENGQIDGLGTLQSPWPFEYLARRINHSADTIIVKNGTYPGHWITWVHGSKGKPVVIKSETWMGAKLRGIDERTFFIGGEAKGTTKIIQSKGDYVYWVDFEIYDDPANGNRIFNNGIDNFLSDGFHLYGKESKIINCVAHDVMIGFSMWSSSVAGELYGNIAYNIGWNNLKSSRKNKGHGHGYYIQSKHGVKTYKFMTNNCAWGTASEGLHLYTQKGNIDYFDIGYNAVFNLIGYNQLATPGRSFVLGGFVGANYLRFHNNLVFGNTTQLGYNQGPYIPNLENLKKPYPDEKEKFRGEAIHVLFDNNYLHGGFTSKFVRDFDSFSGNIFYSENANFAIFITRDTKNPAIIWKQPFDNNLIYGGKRIGHQSVPIAGTNYYEPDGWGFQGQNHILPGVPKDSVILIPNKYEPKRANLYIFNWSQKESVNLSLGEFASAGDTLEIRDIQNPDNIIFSGVYNGHAQTFPMRLTAIARIKGNLPSDHAKHSDKRFGSFILFNRSAASQSQTDPEPNPDPDEGNPGANNELLLQRIDLLAAKMDSLQLSIELLNKKIKNQRVEIEVKQN